MSAGGGQPAPQLRVLAVLMGPTAEAVLGTDQLQLGPLEELSGLPEAVVSLHVMHEPITLQELQVKVAEWRPSLVYVGGGTAATKEDLAKGTVQPMALLFDPDGKALPEAAETFQQVLKGQDLACLYLDCKSLGSEVAEGCLGVEAPPRCVVAWPADVAPPALPAADAARCFFALLRDGALSVPEAYVLACHMAKARSTVPPPLESAPPTVPPLAALLGAPPPPLPDNSSVPPLELAGADLSAGVAAAFPGYSELRLLAPNAEMRLLLAGTSAMANPNSLRYVGEALRALLAAQARRLELLTSVQTDRPPAHLPMGCTAMRCAVRTPGGGQATVTLGGPLALLRNKDVVQYALRQALTADAHTLQLKVPPPGVPPPPTQSHPEVAEGAPLVECLAVSSVWCLQLLKSLAQDASYRGLVALGLASVSATPVAAFNASDAARLGAIVNRSGGSLAQVFLGEPPVTPGAAAAAAAGGAAPMAPGAAASPSLPAAGAAQAAAGPGLSSQPSMQLTGSGPSASLAHSGSSAGTAAATAAAAAGPPQQQPSLQLSAGSGLLPPLNSGGASGSLPELSSGGPAAAAAAAPAASPAAEAKPSLALLMQQQAAAMQQAAAAGGPLPWKSSRPPLSVCSEEQFYSDLIVFLTDRQGRQIDPRTFPETTLNGGKLDLYRLYKEVCSRGGYKVGNGINWKGQVFPRMRNFTAQHKMTGVGNALKRHYQVFLLEYEQAHPEDITGDRCAICGRGDEGWQDWISCDACDCWVHFSCDTRQGRGAFKDYSQGRGRIYHCPRCSEVRRQQSMQAQAAVQAQAATQAAVAAQMAAAMQRLQQQQAPGEPAAQQQQQQQHPAPAASGSPAPMQE